MSRSRERAEKEQVVDTIMETLGVEDHNKLPEVIQMMMRQLQSPPCLVSFVFDVGTGMLRQVAVSDVPRTPAAYQKVSQVTAQLAQQFSNVSVQLASAENQQEETNDA